MSSESATALEEQMNETVFATIEELVVAKVQYGNDEFIEALERLDQVIANAQELREKVWRLEKEVRS